MLINCRGRSRLETDTVLSDFTLTAQLELELR